MFKHTGKYAFAVDSEEYFTGEYDSIEDAFEEGIQEAEEDAGNYDDEVVVYAGEILNFVPIVDADYVIERILDSVNEGCYECIEGYLTDVKREDRDMLQEMLTKTFNEWAEKTNNKPNFFIVEDWEEKIVKVNDEPSVQKGE